MTRLSDLTKRLVQWLLAIDRVERVALDTIERMTEEANAAIDSWESAAREWEHIAGLWQARYEALVPHADMVAAAPMLRQIDELDQLPTSGPW